MSKTTTKQLIVVMHPVSGEQIALLREKSDFKGFYDQDYIKQRYLKLNHENDCTYRQNAPYVNPRIHSDLLFNSIKPILTKIMDCANEREIGIAKKMKQAYNKLFKLQNKYYSTKK